MPPPTDQPAAVDGANWEWTRTLLDCLASGTEGGLTLVFTADEATATGVEVATLLDALDTARAERDRYAEDALGFMAKADSLSEQLAAAREEARIEWEATRETLAHAEQDREELTQQRDAAREEAQKWQAYATRLAKRVDVVERRLADRGDELDAARGEALRMDEQHRQARTAWMAALEEVRVETVRLREALLGLRSDRSVEPSIRLWADCVLDEPAALAATDTAVGE